jgi:hypothetical protein
MRNLAIATDDKLEHKTSQCPTFYRHIVVFLVTGFEIVGNLVPGKFEC